jgi:hypothetical protein
MTMSMLDMFIEEVPVKLKKWFREDFLGNTVDVSEFFYMHSPSNLKHFVSKAKTKNDVVWINEMFAILFRFNDLQKTRVPQNDLYGSNGMKFYKWPIVRTTACSTIQAGNGPNAMKEAGALSFDAINVNTMESITNTHFPSNHVINGMIYHTLKVSKHISVHESIYFMVDAPYSCIIWVIMPKDDMRPNCHLFTAVGSEIKEIDKETFYIPNMEIGVHIMNIGTNKIISKGITNACDWQLHCDSSQVFSAIEIHQDKYSDLKVIFDKIPGGETIYVHFLLRSFTSAMSINGNMEPVRQVESHLNEGLTHCYCVLSPADFTKNSLVFSGQNTMFPKVFLVNKITSVKFCRLNTIEAVAVTKPMAVVYCMKQSNEKSFVKYMSRSLLDDIEIDIAGSVVVFKLQNKPIAQACNYSCRISQRYVKVDSNFIVGTLNNVNGELLFDGYTENGRQSITKINEIKFNQRITTQRNIKRKFPVGIIKYIIQLIIPVFLMILFREIFPVLISKYSTMFDESSS